MKLIKIVFFISFYFFIFVLAQVEMINNGEASFKKNNEFPRTIQITNNTGQVINRVEIQITNENEVTTVNIQNPNLLTQFLPNNPTIITGSFPTNYTLNLTANEYFFNTDKSPGSATPNIPNGVFDPLDVLQYQFNDYTIACTATGNQTNCNGTSSIVNNVNTRYAVTLFDIYDVPFQRCTTANVTVQGPNSGANQKLVLAVTPKFDTSLQYDNSLYQTNTFPAVTIDQYKYNVCEGAENEYVFEVRNNSNENPPIPTGSRTAFFYQNAVNDNFIK